MNESLWQKETESDKYMRIVFQHTNKIILQAERTAESTLSTMTTVSSTSTARE